MSATNSLTASSSSGAVAGFTAVASTSASSAQSGINVDEELAASMVQYNDDQTDLVNETSRQPPTVTAELDGVMNDDSDPEGLTKDRGMRRRRKIPHEVNLELPSERISTGKRSGPAAKPDRSSTRSNSGPQRSRRPPTPPDSRTSSMERSMERTAAGKRATETEGDSEYTPRRTRRMNSEPPPL